MAESLKQRLKPLYRLHWLPFVRASATLLFRIGVDLAAVAGVIRPAQSNDPESFLIISLAGHLGDAVMLLPMIEALHRAHPNARIEVAVEATAAPLFSHIAIVDGVHAFRLGSRPPATLTLSTMRFVAILRAWWPMRYLLRPTTVILPRWGDDLFRSTTLAYLTQALRRVGFASDVNPAGLPAPYRDKLLTELIRGGSGMHEPARFVFLLEQANLSPLVDLGAVSISAVPSLCGLARTIDWTPLSARLNLEPDRPFAVIAPGASMPRRVWPLENWLPVIGALTERGIKTVLLAGQSDATIARQLHVLAPDQTILVAATTTLLESAALIAHASLFLGNDSGPGHLAGALAIPSIILYIAEPGCDPNLPAAPERVRPVGPHVYVLRPARCEPPCAGACSASDAHCIRAITPDAVVPLLTTSHR